ncbi:MAG TPA: glycosyltransferase [Pyrinomonadaceae bacterium]|nr:glycosyltransferase [Pyrinomonadaceae bacterium]HMP66301.1 glycosyltransferase [Pyrinomonadaceae bacterium]
MNILWLKTELLHPVDKGGKIRTYQMLREIRKQHNVTYLTLDDGTADPDALEKAEEYSTEVIAIPHRTAPKFGPRFYAELAANLVSPLPYFMAKYRSAEMARRIREEAGSGRYDILVCDFLQPSINMPETGGCPALLFQHNVEAMIWKRHAEVAQDPIKKAYFARQWQRTVRYEKEACRRFDAVVAVSREDAEHFRSEYEVKHVFDIPTGVDTEYFAERNGFAPGNANLVFTGSMDWLPNHDAILWFVREVLPLVRRTVPEASLTVVGRDPFPEILAAAERDPRITVTGRVPDVRPYMSDAAVYAVPIRIGGGTRLKIYEAMSMGLPVVSTTVGAEGLPLSDGDEILLRDSPADFAEAIVRLLRDRDDAKTLGKSGAARVRNEFGWARVADRFSEICEQTAAGPGRKGRRS